MPTVQTSTIPAVRAALKELIEDLDLRWGTADAEKVGVSIGEPPGGFRQQHIIIGEVPQSDSDQAWSHLGHLTRSEQYTIDVVIRVTVPGKTCDEAQQRAYEIGAELEQELRQATSVNLGLAADGVIAAEFAQPYDVLTMTDEGGACAVVWSLRVKSSLRVRS